MGLDSSANTLCPGAIPYPELLAYAQSISAFTSAPPNMPELVPGQPPPPLFFPPFPNEEKMRRGHMNDEAPLGLLGETHDVGKGTYSSIISGPISISYVPRIGDTSDPLQIKSIEVFPDPPKPGQDMTVKVKAYAQELIEVCIRHFLSQN